MSIPSPKPEDLTLVALSDNDSEILTRVRCPLCPAIMRWDEKGGTLTCPTAHTPAEVEAYLATEWKGFIG